MPVPTLAVINFTTTLNDDEVLQAIHAVNRQINENFAPIWGYARTPQFFVPNFHPADPDTLAQEKVNADSVMYLVDEASVKGALGFHDLNARDLPVGFVFVLDPKDWTTTLSHETLELILDPTVNVLVPGPDPRNPGRTVLHSYEACDAVERLSYVIDGVRVSDFVTPSYFTRGEVPGKRNDFLGVGVKSFGVTKGSHVAFLDPSVGKFVTVVGKEGADRKRTAARLAKQDHEKPSRPDDKIQAVLRQYQETKPMPNASGLRDMTGITRTARYAALEQRWNNR